MNTNHELVSGADQFGSVQYRFKYINRLIIRSMSTEEQNMTMMA